jgi:hypothetical protein
MLILNVKKKEIKMKLQCKIHLSTPSIHNGIMLYILGKLGSLPADMFYIL